MGESSGPESETPRLPGSEVGGKSQNKVGSGQAGDRPLPHPHPPEPPGGAGSADTGTSATENFPDSSTAR